LGDERKTSAKLNHPQTQGKIERWHQTLKNRILLENYYLPGDLERQISSQFFGKYGVVSRWSI
jgi:putative transposase